MYYSFSCFSRKKKKNKKANKKTTQVCLPFSMSEVLFLASDKIKCTYIWSCLGWVFLFSVRFWCGFQQPSCQAFSRPEILWGFMRKWSPFFFWILKTMAIPLVLVLFLQLQYGHRCNSLDMPAESHLPFLNHTKRDVLVLIIDLNKWYTHLSIINLIAQMKNLCCVPRIRMRMFESS